MSFVDGTLAKPEITADDYKSWCRYNSMIIGWIVSALDPQIAASVLYADSARDVWVDLEDRFGQACSASPTSGIRAMVVTIQNNLSWASRMGLGRGRWATQNGLKEKAGGSSRTSESELLDLQREKLKAMDVKDTVERLEMSLKLANNNISILAAKLAIQSLDLQ
ncbi:hypothetical protein AgCh_012733 [Apium graveolens]